MVPISFQSLSINFPLLRFFFLQTFLQILFFLLMELAIAAVIQSLDVKEERYFDITYGQVCLEVCLLLA